MQSITLPIAFAMYVWLIHSYIPTYNIWYLFDVCATKICMLSQVYVYIGLGLESRDIRSECIR